MNDMITTNRQQMMIERQPMLSTNRQIKIFQLLTLRQAVKLECLGMKRRGKSATVIVKDMLGLRRNLKSIEVLAVMDYALSRLNKG